MGQREHAQHAGQLAMRFYSLSLLAELINQSKALTVFISDIEIHLVTSDELTTAAAASKFKPAEGSGF
jgi:hypothetical protein